MGGNVYTGFPTGHPNHHPACFIVCKNIVEIELIQKSILVLNNQLKLYMVIFYFFIFLISVMSQMFLYMIQAD